MRFVLQYLTIFCLMVVISACATTPEYNHLDAQARPLIQNMDSVLISKQTQMDADIKTSKMSQYVQGNIIPVLIDVGLNSIRTHNANKVIMPIRDTLEGYDYTADIKEEFNRALSESTLRGAGDLQLIRQEPQGFRVAMIQHSEADAVMFIDVNYAFTPSFDSLNLVSSIMIFPVNTDLSPYKEKPDTDDVIELSDNIYRNQFMASIPSGIDGKRAENGAIWMDMSEEELTGKLQKAARKLAAHIAADLSTDDVSEDVSDETKDSETDKIKNSETN